MKLIDLQEAKYAVHPAIKWVDNTITNWHSIPKDDEGGVIKLLDKHVDTTEVHDALVKRFGEPSKDIDVYQWTSWSFIRDGETWYLTLYYSGGADPQLILIPAYLANKNF